MKNRVRSHRKWHTYNPFTTSAEVLEGDLLVLRALNFILKLVIPSMTNYIHNIEDMIQMRL